MYSICVKVKVSVRRIRVLLGKTLKTEDLNIYYRVNFIFNHTLQLFIYFFSFDNDICRTRYF